MKNLKVKSILFSLLAVMAGIIFMPSCVPTQTGCNLDGQSTVVVGEIVTFTFTTDIPNPDIEWVVHSGDIILQSGQGTSTATFLINGSGEISAAASNGVLCLATELITAIAPPCEKHIADIQAELDDVNCYINIWDAAYPGDDCGPYTYEWEVEGICQGNTMPFGDTHSTGFHAQYHNGSNNFTVYVTVTNDAGSQIAPYRFFNLYHPNYCNMQTCTGTTPCDECTIVSSPTIGQEQTSSLGYNIVFNANTNTNAASCSYDGNKTWDYGDGTSDTTGIHIYSAAGSYEVCVSTISYTNEGTECNDSACSTINVGT